MQSNYQSADLDIWALNYRRLSIFLKKETIPHALLFSGIEGIGKLSAAMRFAMECNCVRSKESGVRSKESATKSQEPRAKSPSTPCSCKSCRKIQSGNHPDIHLIKPSGNFIKIDQIRELCYTLSMKPYEAKTRVVIISDANKMNPEASNALLKALEEPPERTMFILTTIQASDLLPTIVSRCQHIRFSSPFLSQDGIKKLEGLLIEKEGVSPDEAGIIASLANGSLSKAVSMSKMNWICWRNWLINELEWLLSGKSGTARVLAVAEKLSKNKEMLSDSLEMMNTWFRDLVLCKLMSESGIPYDSEKLINKDMANQIQNISKVIPITSLLSKIKAIQSAQKNLRTNANVRLISEVLMIRLGKIR